MSIFFFIEFHDSVIVGVHINHKGLVDLLPDVVLNFGGSGWLEGQFVALLFENLINNIGDYFREVQIYQAGR